jgi:hypothetical protein
MAEPSPGADASAHRRKVGEAVVAAWKAFFDRFRADEQEFEKLQYLEDASAIAQHLTALPAGTLPDDATLGVMLEQLDRFAVRRFDEQNRRIDELMDLCEQMRTRLEASDLTRSHLEDEASHCNAIVRAAMERLKLGEPEALTHAPRLHNLFSHVLSHFEPDQRRMDTTVFRRQQALTPKPEDPPALFDYDRLRRLFRKG